MKEKTKILMNEVEILRNESLQKDMALQKERLGHGNSFYARDQLRVEQNRNITLEKESKGKVDHEGLQPTGYCHSLPRTPSLTAASFPYYRSTSWWPRSTT